MYRNLKVVFNRILIFKYIFLIIILRFYNIFLLIVYLLNLY